MTRLAGKRVAVIGAGSVGEGWGNGKATAVRFAQEGAKVLCVDMNQNAAQETAELIAAKGGSAAAFAADVTDPGAGDAILGAMQARWSGLDVLHFNVGISSVGGVVETDDADWNRIFDINLTSAMRLTRACLPPMREQGSGVFIYVSSLAATYSGPYSYVSYEASKAALCRMARSVAKENAPFGIRANTILPGVIDTPHVQKYVADGTDLQELQKKRAEMVPMARQGTAWDIANAALYLASDEAGFVTGVDLRVDGGLGG